LRPDNTHHLHAAQRAARQELDDRARQAIRALDGRGEPVTFASVARASGVSRSFLNKVPKLATEIRRLRAQRPSTGPAVPTAQRMSDSSKDARISQLKEANRKLREEARWLRDENAVLLGKLRDGA
jgi:hypothetical protein